MALLLKWLETNNYNNYFDQINSLINSQQISGIKIINKNNLKIW